MPLLKAEIGRLPHDGLAAEPFDSNGFPAVPGESKDQTDAALYKIPP